MRGELIMKAKDYISLWFKGITDAEKTVKKLEKGKMRTKEGITSIGFFSLLVGIILLLISIPFMKTTQSAIMATVELLIILPFAAIVGLLIFSAVLSFISNNVGGKTSTSKITGLFGFIAPMMFLISIPVFIAMFLGALSRNVLVYWLLMGIGGLITATAGGVVNALMLQALSGTQKTSLVKAGLVYGATVGVIILVIYLVIGLLGAATMGATSALPSMM